MNSPLLLFNALQLNVDLDEIGVIERSDFPPRCGKMSLPLSMQKMTALVSCADDSSLSPQLGRKLSRRDWSSRAGEVITLRQPPDSHHGDVHEK